VEEEGKEGLAGQAGGAATGRGKTARGGH